MAELSTEEKILRAAAKVFTEKGFDATKTRDIAEAADTNIASLHYYFRSKEKLFELIIDQTMVRFSQIMDDILNTERPLHQKIREFVPAYIDFLRENSFLPMFILSESQKNAERIDRMMNDAHHMPILRKQMDELEEAGVIRPMHLAHFFTNLVGLTVFPFLSKPIIKLKTGLDEQAYHQMLEERKQMVPDLIINYLYIKPPE